jgi:hypothetical protein
MANVAKQAIQKLEAEKQRAAEAEDYVAAGNLKEQIGAFRKLCDRHSDLDAQKREAAAREDYASAETCKKAMEVIVGEIMALAKPVFSSSPSQQTTRPRASAPSAALQQPQVVWKCKACTFENTSDGLTCEMCGTSRANPIPDVPIARATAVPTPVPHVQQSVPAVQAVPVVQAVQQSVPAVQAVPVRAQPVYAPHCQVQPPVYQAPYNQRGPGVGMAVGAGLGGLAVGGLGGMLLEKSLDRPHHGVFGGYGGSEFVEVRNGGLFGGSEVVDVRRDWWGDEQITDVRRDMFGNTEVVTETVDRDFFGNVVDVRETIVDRDIFGNTEVTYIEDDRYW